MFTTTFENGILQVFKNGTLTVIQPFKPTSSGAQLAWSNEQDALNWWLTVKHLYEYELPEVPVETSETTPTN